MTPLAGLRVFESEYVGTLVTPDFPPVPAKYRRGPYQQRRMRRWARRWRAAHPIYWRANGTVLLAEHAGFVLVHPHDAAKVRELLRGVLPSGNACQL